MVSHVNRCACLCLWLVLCYNDHWLVLVEETGGLGGYERFTCGVTMKEPKYIGLAPLRGDILVLDMGYCGELGKLPRLSR